MGIGRTRNIYVGAGAGAGTIYTYTYLQALPVHHSRPAFHTRGQRCSYFTHNYEPGKIGGVGSVLGRYGTGLISGRELGCEGMGMMGREMEECSGGRTRRLLGSGIHTATGSGGDGGALMILGIEGEITRQVLNDLKEAEVVLNVSVVRL
ncbi:hypothetical protein F5X99DRAFT_399598 [Biscogniauxia marginata]|nr:hypothetical protein F5X99DRAFT_399598 [Biscogniauxia marginata]